MKITETRKAIIELIEPYMDKTLSEGCLCFVKGVEERGIVKDCIVKYSSLYDGYTSSKIEYNSLYNKRLIIGHYDITAVLKYIYNHGYEEGDTFIGENYFHFTDLGTIKIPNKPLHLYTEEEDKQLLDLLIKLK